MSNAYTKSNVIVHIAIENHLRYRRLETTRQTSPCSACKTRVPHSRLLGGTAQNLLDHIEPFGIEGATGLEPEEQSRSQSLENRRRNERACGGGRTTRMAPPRPHERQQQGK